MSKQALEKHRVFPYIAWMLVIGFAAFVFLLAKDLRRTTHTLEMHADRLEATANTNVTEIDFSAQR